MSVTLVVELVLVKVQTAMCITALSCSLCCERSVHVNLGDTFKAALLTSAFSVFIFFWTGTYTALRSFHMRTFSRLHFLRLLFFILLESTFRGSAFSHFKLHLFLTL